MSRFLIGDYAGHHDQAFPDLTGLRASQGTIARPIIESDDRPVALWRHVLAEGASIRWHLPTIGHCFYVLEGRIEALGGSGERNAVVVVGRGSSGEIVAGAAGATLLHFFSAAEAGSSGSSAQHQAMLVGPEGLYQLHPAAGETAILYADSMPEYSELWLHRAEFAGSVQLAPHMHTEDEIIAVLDGELHFGSRTLRRGQAVAISANAVYAFRTGDHGLSFINFRPQHPFMVPVDRGRKGTPISEQSIARSAAQLPSGFSKAAPAATHRLA